MIERNGAIENRDNDLFFAQGILLEQTQVRQSISYIHVAYLVGNMRPVRSQENVMRHGRGYRSHRRPRSWTPVPLSPEIHG